MARRGKPVIKPLKPRKGAAHLADAVLEDLMILYLDTSSLLKLYVEGTGTNEVMERTALSDVIDIAKELCPKHS